MNSAYCSSDSSPRPHSFNCGGVQHNVHPQGESGLVRRFSAGVLWSFGGTALLRSLSGISTLLAARVLGPEGFGKFTFVQSTVTMFAVYGALRLGMTSAKYVAQYRNQAPRKARAVLQVSLTAALVLCFVMSLVLFAAAPLVAAGALGQASLTGALRCGAVLLLVLTYGNIQQQALLGFEGFRQIAGLNAMRGVLSLTLVAPFAHCWGVDGAILAMIAVAGVSLPCGHILLRRACTNAALPHRVATREARAELPILWQFALPGFLFMVVSTAAEWLGRVVVVRASPGLAGLGVFEAANQWRTLVLLLPAAAATTILPILANSSGNARNAELRAGIRLQMQTVCLTALPFALMTIGFSREIIGLFGRGYSEAAIILPLVMLSVFCHALSQGLRAVYDASGRPWTNLVLICIWALVYLLSCRSLVPRFGLAGFAFTFLVSELFLLVMLWGYLDLRLVPGSLRPCYGEALLGISLLACSYLSCLSLSRGWNAAVTLCLLTVSLGRLVASATRLWNRRNRSD